MNIASFWKRACVIASLHATIALYIVRWSSFSAKCSVKDEPALQEACHRSSRQGDSALCGAGRSRTPGRCKRDPPSTALVPRSATSHLKNRRGRASSPLKELTCRSCGALPLPLPHPEGRRCARHIISIANPKVNRPEPRCPGQPGSGLPWVRKYQPRASGCLGGEHLGRGSDEQSLVVPGGIFTLTRP